MICDTAQIKKVCKSMICRLLILFDSVISGAEGTPIEPLANLLYFIQTIKIASI
jgi:hypothetical protein